MGGAGRPPAGHFPAVGKAFPHIPPTHFTPLFSHRHPMCAVFPLPVSDVVRISDSIENFDLFLCVHFPLYDFQSKGVGTHVSTVLDE